MAWWSVGLPVGRRGKVISEHPTRLVNVESLLTDENLSLVSRFFVTTFCLFRENPQRNEVRKFLRPRLRLPIRRKQVCVCVL